MNIGRLQECIKQIDDIKVIGKNIKIEDAYYHIIGIAQVDGEMKLYILSYEHRDKEQLRPKKRRSKRQEMRERLVRERNPFFEMKALQIGSQCLQLTGGSSSAVQQGEDMESVFILAEFIKAGWHLSKDHLFARKCFESLMLTTMDIEGNVESLSHLEGKTIQVTYRQTSQSFLLEKSITLEVDNLGLGKKKSFKFKLEDDRECRCYINKVEINDLRADYEEKFKDPRYLEHMTKEELEEMKQQSLKMLDEHCPIGMGYVFVEYECSEPIRLDIYSKEAFKNHTKKKIENDEKIGEDMGYLPEAKSSSSMVIIAKSDELIGPRGLSQRTSVIQMPIDKKTEKIKAEIFSYQILIPERTVVLKEVDEEEVNLRKNEINNSMLDETTRLEIIKKYSL